MFDAGVISAREAASVTRCVSYGDSCHFSLDRVNELQCEIGEDWHDRKGERPLQACCEPAPGGEVQMPLQLWKSRFDADEGILYAGRVREKARVCAPSGANMHAPALGIRGRSMVARWRTTTTAWATTSAHSA